MPILIKDGQKKYFSIPDTAKARSEGWSYADSTVSVTLAGQQFDVPSESADLVLQHPSITFAEPSSDFAARKEDILAQEYEDTGSQISAFAEGFGRTLSFGGTDVINRALGESADDIRQRRERNSTALAGELAGIVPSLFIGGGSGSTGTIGRLIPAGSAAALGAKTGAAIGGVRGAIAAGVTEGALYGVGQGISNLAITDKPLTASAVIEELGWNALVGGGTGALAGAVTGGLGKLAEKSKNKALQELVVAETENNIRTGLRELDNVHKTVTKELTSTQTINKELFDQRLALSKQADDFIKPFVVDAGTTEVQNLYKAAITTRNSLEKAVASSQLKTASQLLKSYENQLVKLGRLTGEVEAVAELSALKSTPLLQKGLQGGTELTEKLNAAREPLKALSRPLTQITGDEALKIASGLDDYALVLSQVDNATQKTYSNQIQNLMDSWSTVINKGLPENLKKASGTDLLKMIAGAGIAGDLEGDLVESIPVLGPAADTFIKVWLASKVIGPAGRVAASKVKRLAEHSQVLGRIGGRAAGRLGAKAGRATAGTLGDAAGYTLGAKLGQNVIDSVLGVGQGMATAASKAKQTISTITQDLLKKSKAREVGSRVGPAIFSEITSESDTNKSFDKFIESLQVDTNTLNMEALTQGNSEVSDLVLNQLTNTRDYLLSIAPKNPVQNPYLSGIKWKPSKQELLTYSLAVNAAFKPTNTLKKLNGGMLHPIEAETLRNLHPRLLEILQEDLLTNDINELSRHDKLQLSILFNVPIGYDLNVGSSIQRMFITQGQSNKIQVNGQMPNQYTSSQQTIQSTGGY